MKTDEQSGRYLVVFDLDDTLYPERAFIGGGLKAAAAILPPESRGPFVEEANAALRDGMRGVRNILATALSRCSTSSIDIDRLEQAYRLHSPQLQPWSGIPDVLVLLATMADLAVLSDGRHEEQTRKWDA